MASLLGIKFHTAHFFDTSGQFIASYRFKISTKWGIKEKIFKYKYGTYNIKPNASNQRLIYFPYLVDHVIYFYTIGNPDPLIISHDMKPLINAYDYNVQLETKILTELNKVRQSGLMALLTPRNIIIGIIILVAVFYFASGGDISSLTSSGGSP